MGTTFFAYTLKKPSRIVRLVRAFGRDTWALWTQFQRPILAFIFVTFIGGMLHGELYEFAGKGELPLANRPLMMLQMMILESPYDTPSEPYLIVFWYALPVVFIFIVGNGVADFVRLFFNRDGRRVAWREALVSTYRNHVIVLGAGHVGIRVIRVLAELGVDVVVIEINPSKECEFVLNELRIPMLIEDGRATTTLIKAGLQHAEAFLTCTGDDHINLESIMKVRQINPNVRIVARVWDDNLGVQLQKFLGVNEIISSSGISAPVFAGLALGVELTQTIQIEGENYSTVKLKVGQNSFLTGRTVEHVQAKEDCDIVLLVRNGKSTVQPDGEVIITVGDTLVIFAKHQRTLYLARKNHSA
jgi:voltage-gated potassium channel